MEIKKFCSRCNINIIDYKDKYCPSCASKLQSRHKEYKQHREDIKEQSFYTSTEWKTVRLKIKARDNGLCLLCLDNNLITPMNTVHHITELKEDWNERFNRENLICICEACHQKIHKEYKVNNERKRVVQQQLKSLIDKFKDE
ncbi:HNH endonuclease [Clostridium perfringens]|uniref:HNH endonuclease n=1 Tax=Clostridium perfringens TaxID=1502 RepID=UPI0030D8414A